jgi:ABC-type sugar transport system ATPase subunit
VAEPFLLEMRGISKSFGGNPVLRGVDFELARGEVHALVGENGAGKSTLMKIASGVYRRDGGELRLDGRPLDVSGPQDARRAGIRMIFQEQTLAPDLTVAENIFLGAEPVRGPGVLRRAEMLRAAAELLARHDFGLQPAARVGRLTAAERQRVEVARALAGATRVVVMDEPTAMLSQPESEQLWRIIGELRARGLGVVYISHRMEELPRVADRVTILRDGRRVFTGAIGAIAPPDIIRHMVGREVRELYPALPAPGTDVVLEVRGLSGPGYRDVSFDLRRGEILGVAGLVGAGRTAMARGIFGIEPPIAGQIRLDGRPVRLGSSAGAIASGLGFLTEDRKRSGLFPHLSVAHNVSMAALGSVTAWGILRRGEEARRCRDLVRRLDVRAPSAEAPVHGLSGGNQQKALIARWLFAGSRILILDEPTQGVDLGARAEIYRLMADLAGRGTSILLVSSDLPEILGMSHRILVMRRGEVAATLEAAGTGGEDVMRHAALVP